MSTRKITEEAEQVINEAKIVMDSEKEESIRDGVEETVKEENKIITTIKKHKKAIITAAVGGLAVIGATVITAIVKNNKSSNSNFDALSGDTETFIDTTVEDDDESEIDSAVNDILNPDETTEE